MLRNTALGLAAAASLTLAALTPALANYSHCDEEPYASGCPAYIPSNMMGNEYSTPQGATKGAKHAHSYKAPTPTVQKKG